MARDPRFGTRRFPLLIAVCSIGALMLVTPSFAAPRGSSACTRSAPRAAFGNTYAWAAPGSWGMPGQPLTYAIDVFNNDLGCDGSTFVVTMSAPTGFSVSMPTNTISLPSAGTGYVWATVTSPTTAGDGDHPLTVSVSRAGVDALTDSSPPGTSAYKVYSSDTAAPQLYWLSPENGAAVVGRTLYVSGASIDDHAVREMDLAIDGNPVTTAACTNISFECRVSYKWSVRRVHGVHTATFTSTDWMGNAAVETVTFTVN